jgi:hypothetical protein
MLLVCICGLLKSVVRYKILTLYTYHPYIRMFTEQSCEEPWILFEAKRVRRAKKRGRPCSRVYPALKMGQYFVSKRRKRINQWRSDVSQKKSVVIRGRPPLWQQRNWGQVSQLTLQENSVRHFVLRRTASWRSSHGVARTSGRTRLGVRLSRRSFTSFSP